MGLSAATFVKNTGQEMPMLFGNITSIGMGAFFTILVTYITRWNMTPEIEEEEWEKTRDIVNRKFRAAKITSYIAAVCFTILFVVIWPGSMLTIDIFDYYQFNTWTVISRGWAFTASAFIVVAPMFQEVKAVLKQLARNKEDKTSMTDEHMPLSKVDINQDTGMPNPSFTSSAQQNRSKSNYIYQRFINLLTRNLRISRN